MATIRLGKNQIEVLKMLESRGYWYPYCGWRWRTEGQTQNMINNLREKGLVHWALGVTKYHDDGYELTEHGVKYMNMGKENVFQPININES